MDFSSFASLPDAELDLFSGALLIAQDAYPSLDLGLQRRRMQSLCDALAPEALSGAALERQLDELRRVMFELHAFSGNRDDYYDPRNSFINDVLERRVGIPITLALVYCELSRHSGVHASGVAFPGHFLVRVEHAEEPAAFVDVFNGAETLDADGLSQLLRRSTGQRGPVEQQLCAPAGVRQTLVRMLMNLRGIYALRGDFQRLLLVLDRIVELMPRSAGDLRDRGLLAARLGAPAAAVEDFRRYVRLAPDAGDVAEIRRLIEELSPKCSRNAN